MWSEHVTPTIVGNMSIDMLSGIAQSPKSKTKQWTFSAAKQLSANSIQSVQTVNHSEWSCERPQVRVSNWAAYKLIRVGDYRQYLSNGFASVNHVLGSTHRFWTSESDSFKGYKKREKLFWIRSSDASKETTIGVSSN